MKILLLSLSFLFLIISSKGQYIERMEPPNWWLNMKHNDIQLMFYGKDIQNLIPTTSYKGVTIKGIEKVDNPNYLFVKINISKEAKAGQVEFVFEQNNKSIVKKSFELLGRNLNRSEMPGFNNADAIYLITPDRFVNGDPTNDNIDGYRETMDRTKKGGRHGGDLKGLSNALTYIKNLGFSAIWLNPLLENDMEVYSYHGYSTTDYYKIDPRFGTNAEYQAMADKARGMGLKLIMDMIVNHCGSFHWWMDDLPSDDWINQWSKYTGTNHRKSLLQDPYASAIDKKIFTDGWFVPTMPDLNQRNPIMAQYLIQNSIWWVEYLGLAGIRMDTYPYPDMDFMTDWTEALMREYPQLNIVGEEWHEDPAIVAYWQKGKENPNGYTSALKSIMDFPLQAAMINGLKNEDSWNKGLMEIYEMLSKDFLYAEPQNLVVFPDNHDMSRIFTQVNEDYNLFKQAIAYVMTIRGIPQFYYGTEILMKNPGTTDHGIIRSDFPGGWKDDTINAFTGQGITTEQKVASSFMSKLLKWRKTATAIHHGSTKHFIPQSGIYVYFRYDEAQKVMVVINKNENEKELKLDRFSEVIEHERIGEDVISGKIFNIDDHIMLPAKSVLVLDCK